MLGDWVHEAAGTVFGRWYVTIFGVVFLRYAVRDLVWRRTLLYSAIALFRRRVERRRRDQPPEERCPRAADLLAPVAAGCSSNVVDAGTLASVRRSSSADLSFLR